MVWILDRATKAWAEGMHAAWFSGPFGLVLHHNHGAMLGLFSDLPAVLRVVSLSTGGAFLLFAFGIVQYLMPIKSILLRSGLSMLLGGIIGNVTDRIMNGYVIDFLVVGSANRPSPAFNLADAFQWVGYAMVAYALIRESAILWPTENTRKAMWVNARFQLRYCLLLMGIGLGFALIAGVYSYTFLRVTILDLIGNDAIRLNHYLVPFVATFAIVSVGFSMILFLAGRILSQRIAGPVYAFERFLDDAIAGKPRALRLRAGDEFKHLEEVAAKILDELAARRPNLAPVIPAVDESIPEPADGVGGAALRRTSGDPR